MELRRQISAIAAGAAIAAAAVLFWQSAKPPVYSATSLVTVEPAPTTATTAGGRPENIVFLARTYAARATTTPVMSRAAERADVSLDADDALARTTVEVSNSDATITITATGSTPRQAKSLAVALTSELKREARKNQLAFRRSQVAPLQARATKVERKLAGLPRDSTRRLALQHEYQALVAARAQARLRPLDRLHVLSPPAASSEPVSPQPLRAGLLAFLVAAVVGTEGVVGWRLLRRRPRATERPVVAAAG